MNPKPQLVEVHMKKMEHEQAIRDVVDEIQTPPLHLRHEGRSDIHYLTSPANIRGLSPLPGRSHSSPSIPQKDEPRQNVSFPHWSGKECP